MAHQEKFVAVDAFFVLFPSLSRIDPPVEEKMTSDPRRGAAAPPPRPRAPSRDLEAGELLDESLSPPRPRLSSPSSSSLASVFVASGGGGGPAAVFHDDDGEDDEEEREEEGRPRPALPSRLWKLPSSNDPDALFLLPVAFGAFESFDGRPAAAAAFAFLLFLCCRCRFFFFFFGRRWRRSRGGGARGRRLPSASDRFFSCRSERRSRVFPVRF